MRKEPDFPLDLDPRGNHHARRDPRPKRRAVSPKASLLERFMALIGPFIGSVAPISMDSDLGRALNWLLRQVKLGRRRHPRDVEGRLTRLANLVTDRAYVMRAIVRHEDTAVRNGLKRQLYHGSRKATQNFLQ
jgi:hypothetical protein